MASILGNDILFETLRTLADEVIEKITYHHKYNITSKQHPKQICDKMRLINKPIKFYFETILLDRFNTLFEKNLLNFTIDPTMLLFNLFKYKHNNYTSMNMLIRKKDKPK